MFRQIGCSLTILWLLSSATPALSADEIPSRSGATITNVLNATAQLPSPVESLAMLMQVVNRIEFFVKSKDLSSVHNEDLILSTAIRGLLAAAPTEVPGQAPQFKADLTAFGVAVSTLHSQADSANQAGTEAELGQVLAQFSVVLDRLSETTRASANKMAFRFMCPMHPDVTGKKTDLCPKCGMELDQLVRILPSASGLPMALQQTIRATITTIGSPRIARMATALLRLERVTGEPVLLSDLIEAHTEKIHLLIIDPSLTDYHHEHPRPMDKPGEYTFKFSPRKPGSYRVWADLRPYPLGLQEYVMTDIPASTSAETFTNRSLSFNATVDGLNYELIPERKEIKVGKSVSAKLRITAPDGQGFTQLEPVMATFAHIVGFNEDFKTVLHMHPKGPPITDPLARGGPELEFQIYALQPGFYRVFAQVQIGGYSRFAPFGIRVEP